MLTAKTKQLVNGINDLMGDYMDLIGGKEIMNLNTDEFKAIKSTMELMKLANDVVIAQAKALDDMNHKLDILLLKEGHVCDDLTE